jgi:glycosyltransferase involved in cell wall biosynthesis
MSEVPKATLCLIPRVHGVGGMVSFRHKLGEELARRGYALSEDVRDPAVDAALVIGGTRDLRGLRSLKGRGVPVIQRLDGMNWLHRKLKTGLRHWLRAEMGNLLLNTIRTRLASGIVYQSNFSKQWWERQRGTAGVPDRVIYNGVDLAVYTPDGAHTRPDDHYRLLLVEGSLQGGYETGLEMAVRLAQSLITNYQLPITLSVAGKISEDVKANHAAHPLEWLGLVPREGIPELDRSAHLLFSADLNAACPNAVIEALACGLPVAAFDTGALAELVDQAAGRVTPYGSGSPWNLDPPDVERLAAGAAEILRGGESFRRAARARAEVMFGLPAMTNGYLEALLG